MVQPMHHLVITIDIPHVVYHSILYNEGYHEDNHKYIDHYGYNGLWMHGKYQDGPFGVS